MREVPNAEDLYFEHALDGDQSEPGSLDHVERALDPLQPGEMSAEDFELLRLDLAESLRRRADGRGKPNGNLRSQQHYLP